MSKNMSKTPHIVDGEASESDSEEIEVKERYLDSSRTDMRGSVVMGEASESDDEPIMPMRLFIKKEPGLLDMSDDEPESQDMDDDDDDMPLSQKIKKEPGTQRVKREPGSPRVKREPGVRVKKEPGTQRVKKEPGTQRVKREPGAPRVKRQPGAPRLIRKDFMSQGTSSSNPRPSNESVLHQKLWECNVSLRASLEGLLHHTTDIAIEKLTSTDQTLLNVQESMRATNANLSQARMRLQRLHQELRRASCIMALPTVRI